MMACGWIQSFPPSFMACRRITRSLFFSLGVKRRKRKRRHTHNHTQQSQSERWIGLSIVTLPPFFSRFLYLLLFTTHLLSTRFSDLFLSSALLCCASQLFVMASLSSLSLTAIAHLPSRHPSLQSAGGRVQLHSSSTALHLPRLLLVGNGKSRTPGPAALPSFTAVTVAAAAKTTGDVVPTVAVTKRAFLEGYRKPVPSIYSTVIQELIVQQHLMRYNATYQYDAVFGLGFVTVFDQLFDGYPNIEDKEAIFKAYIGALKEDPDQYRSDATKLEEWAKEQSSTSVVSFAERSGEGEVILKDIAERAGGKGNFHYSRFFAIGLFRLLELAKASDPTILEQLSKALNVNKLSVDRDLDVYRNLLSKLSQAKDLLKEYLDREKRKQAEREAEKTEAAAKKEVTTEAKSE